MTLAARALVGAALAAASSLRVSAAAEGGAAAPEAETAEATGAARPSAGSDFGEPGGAASPSRAGRGLATPSEDEEIDLALAMVVDSREWPEEAAALETRPYRMLLERVRLGAGEKTLRQLAVGFADRRDILRDPDATRGEIVTCRGVIGEIRRVDARRSGSALRPVPFLAPGVGRFDRNRAYAGIVGTGKGFFLAFRALRRPDEPSLYVGDRVWVSGYFLKVTPVLDAEGRTHWVPLVVSPWPTYVGKWWPAASVRRHARGMGFPPPTSEIPHEEVPSRRVLDVESVRREGARDDGGGGDEGDGGVPFSVASAEEGARFAVDGVPLPRDDAVKELRRHASAHPRRAVVVRPSGEAARAAARDLLAEAGVERAVRSKPRGSLREPPGPAVRRR